MLNHSRSCPTLRIPPRLQKLFNYVTQSEKMLVSYSIIIHQTKELRDRERKRNIAKKLWKMRVLKIAPTVWILHQSVLSHFPVSPNVIASVLVYHSQKVQCPRSHVIEPRGIVC